MQQNLPWIEKYRPKTFDDIISHKTIIDILKKTTKEKKLQHLMFHGPPGTGKTSTIMACAKELYGNNINIMTCRQAYKFGPGCSFTKLALLHKRPLTR